MAKATLKELIDSSTPTLVDFYAAWCSPCQMMKPVLEEVKNALQDKVRVIEIDVDKNPSVAQLFNIRGIPTLAIFLQGEVKWMRAGMLPPSELEKVVSRFADASATS